MHQAIEETTYFDRLHIIISKDNGIMIFCSVTLRNIGLVQLSLHDAYNKARLSLIQAGENGHMVTFLDGHKRSWGHSIPRRFSPIRMISSSPLHILEWVLSTK